MVILVISRKKFFRVLFYFFIYCFIVFLLLFVFIELMFFFFYFVVVDIFGLISGVYLNKGLGYVFLRYIERCRCLLYVLDIFRIDLLIIFVFLR